jgi:hypothetical protein
MTHQGEVECPTCGAICTTANANAEAPTLVLGGEVYLPVLVAIRCCGAEIRLQPN